MSEIGDFGNAEKQGLTLRHVAGLVAVKTLGESQNDRSADFLGPGASFVEQRTDAALRRLARTHGHVRTDLLQRPLVLDRAPVPLEALRRHARAYGVAERQTLGKAAIVAIEQRGGIGGEPVNLKETGVGHEKLVRLKIEGSEKWEFRFCGCQAAVAGDVRSLSRSARATSRAIFMRVSSAASSRQPDRIRSLPRSS